jgi:hypothetical protein
MKKQTMRTMTEAPVLPPLRVDRLVPFTVLPFTTFLGRLYPLPYQMSMKMARLRVKTVSKSACPFRDF